MSRRPQIDGEQGFVMYFVIMAMMVILTVSAAIASSGGASITGVNKDELGVRALQAAEAGAQTALHRINLEQPTASQCITTAVANPQTGSNWCTATAAESIGSDQSFTYQTSIEQTSGCTGGSYGTGTVERCVVATGTVAGVSRRVIERIVSSSGASPFPVAGVLGLNYVTISNNANLGSALGTNGQLTVGNNAQVTGGASVWTGGPNPSIGNNAVVNPGVTRTSAAYALSPSNMLNPSTGLDSKTSNDNGRLLAGANPADACSTSSGGCYTNTGGSPRTLSVGNNGSITLGGGVYNFCSVNLSNNASLNIASGARVIMYLDSVDRPGSGCLSGQGNFVLSNNAVLSNPSNDPTAFQLIVYGATGIPTITLSNNIDFVGTIYAPSTNFVFSNNATIHGGISAKSVSLSNNATWDPRVASLRFATTLVFFRGSWTQCASAGGTAASPAVGCL